MDQRRAPWWSLAVLLVAGTGATPGPCRHEFDMGQRPYSEAVCEAPAPDRHRPSLPGLVLDDATYGGTASWTFEGDPPAGDRCPAPPPGISPRR
jgi:hypothetical protein